MLLCCQLERVKNSPVPKDQKEVSTASSQKQTSSNSKASVIFANRLSSLKPKTYSSISSPWLLQGHQECRIQEWQDSTELTIEADSITRRKPKVIQRGNQVERTFHLFFKDRKVGGSYREVLCPILSNSSLLVHSGSQKSILKKQWGIQTNPRLKARRSKCWNL